MPQITSARSLYHECQNQGQCGKHTLNNLVCKFHYGGSSSSILWGPLEKEAVTGLQGPVFSTADLDVIAEKLRQIAQESLQRTIWKNPYKSPMGMGYYDVTVLEAALNEQHCTLSWFDARKGTFSLISFRK
ncbi:Josephin-1 [Mortierella claussenii]|nr:Josephin-1 [Mortierella claussenii]